jgi:predicted amino acid dehydrogenase
VPAAPRFAFLVHPLQGWHRRLLGIRRMHGPLVAEAIGGIEAVGVSARLRLPTSRGEVEGVVVAVPDVAGDLVANQGRALELAARAAAIAESEGARAIGLGNALAVVAGRGAELAARAHVPVTTGHASTAWACSEIVREVLGGGRGPVGLLGFAGTVGDAIAGRLAETAVEVRVEARGAAATRRAAALKCVAVDTIEDVAACAVVVGASTTGPVIDASALRPDAVLIDLALPPTLRPGPVPAGVRRVAGETLSVPGRIHAGFWGAIWLLLAPYPRGTVFACLAEPAAIAAGYAPPGGGRRLDPDAVERAGASLRALGFVPTARPAPGFRRAARRADPTSPAT